MCAPSRRSPPLLPTRMKSKEAVVECVRPSYRLAPTIFALSLLVIAWLANDVALAFIHERVPRDSSPLPDLFFSIFPEVPGSIRIAEYCMLILLGAALLVLALHKHKIVVCRRVFFCVGVAYLFRAFCISILQVPVPSVNTYCAPKEFGGWRVVLTRVYAMFWTAGIEELRPRELCGDLIVSGHTLTIFTALNTFRHYAPRRLQPLSILFSLLALLAIFSILLNRKHYLLDVVLGYLVSTRVFWEYHAMAAAFHEGTHTRNPLFSSLWLRLVPFLESDVPPPHLLPNHLTWPSDCVNTYH